MASIKKLSNGSYQATIYYGRDSNGKQLRKYLTRPTMKECKAAARETEQEIEEGKFINVGNVRLGVWMDKWLELNKDTIAPSTYMSYKLYVNTHFKPYFKNLKLKQINEIHIKQYMSDKLKTLSPTTVRKHMLVLNRILEDALKQKNPARNIKIPKPAEYIPYVLSDKEFEQIHDKVRGTRDEPIVLLAAWCGLRRGEIFALEWKDIDWRNSYITIDKSRSISEDGFISKAPKSKNGIRIIAVPDELIDILKEYRKKDKSLNGRLFNLRPDDYSDHFANIIKKNKLAPIRFHDLRHYHATWLYNQGIPDLYAAKRLGHDIHVLKGIYQHLNLDRAKALDNTIKGIKSENDTAQNTAQNI